MGVIERKEREKEIRKQQILAAGEKLFLKQGLNNTTMEHIANECEISRGTLYLYFKNKFEIFQNIIVRATEILYNMMKENVVEGENPDDNMRKIGEAYLAFYRNYPSYYKLLNLMEEHSPEDFNPHEFKNSGMFPQLLEKTNLIWDLIVAQIENGINQGIFKSNTNPYELSLIIWSASNGIISVMDHFEKSHVGNMPDTLGTFGEMCKLDLGPVLQKLWNMIMSSIRVQS